ncbi:PAS domain S-box protein [Spirulina subsalsa]|uniref:PAS domain S-box protein n=1 Tax=Spirulina subsalsa TaxID=54311 RepID=UPI00036AF7F0|nr:PAS domain S-box protein [Spirulina subsalsa]
MNLPLSHNSHPSASSELAWFKVILEQSPVAIALLDRDLCFILATQRWYQDYQQTEAILGRHYYDVFPDTPDHWRLAHQRALGGETIKEAGEPYAFSPDCIEWVKWEISPWTESGGAIGGVMICSEWITERIQSETYWYEVFNASPSMICIAGLEGQFLHLNPAWETSLGWTREELYAQPYLHWIHPDDRETTLEIAQQLANGVTKVNFENRYRCPDGSYRWLAWTATLLPSQNRMYGLARDVTDRKATEAALRGSEQRYQALAETSPVGIFNGNQWGQCVYANPQLSILTGLSNSNLLQDGWLKAIHPEDRDHVHQEWQRLVGGGHWFQSEFRFLRPDGSIRWVYMQAQALRAEGSETAIQGYVGTCTDVTEHKETEAALRASEQDLRTILNGVYDAIFLHTVEGQIIDVNDPVLELYGVTRETFKEYTLQDYSSPDADFSDIEQKWERAIAGEDLQFEWRAQRPADGYTFDVEVRLRKIVLQSEVVILANVRDITLQKQAREEMQKLVALVENSSDFIGIADLEGNPVFINQAGRNILGVPSVAKAKDFHISQFIHGVDRKRLAQEIMPQLMQQGNWQGEVEFYDFANDQGVPMDSKMFTIQDPDTGETIATATISRDVRDRKQAEAELLRYKQAVDSASDAIGITNAYGQLIYFNQAFGKLYDCESVRQLNRKGGISALFADPTVIQGMFSTVMNRQSWTHEVEQVSLKGKIRPVFLRANAILDQQGQIVGLLGMATDIRERKRAEASLRESEAQLRTYAMELENTLHELQRTQTQLIQREKMSSLGQLVAGVAHEINNPVNFIYGNLSHADQYIGDLIDLIEQYGQQYPQPVPEIAEMIEEIDLEFVLDDLPKLLQSMKVGADRIKGIVASLRNFSRMDEAERKAVNLHDGIDSTLMILHNRLKAKTERPAIAIEKHYGNLPPIECYAGQLNQVFMNILANAIDALEERDQSRSYEEIQQHPSTIEIITEQLNTEQVQVRIQDNGPGIPEHIQPRLFDPFFTTKTIGKGTGLGLSISYQIVTEKHRGQLECLSGPETGTEFRITIPITQSQVNSTSN